MQIYDLKSNAQPPKRITKRKAHIIGGGIAGLSAAVYLIHDIHMPGENITIYDALSIAGGSMDGSGNANRGYSCRGERELETKMECLWDICSKVPSLRNPGNTVLDDVWQFNYEHPIHNNYRLVVQGKSIPCHDFSMDDQCLQAMQHVLFCDEQELADKTIADVFPESFFSTNLWLTFHNMLAFKTYHSAMEAKRYFRRFTHFMPESDYLNGLVHTDMNEYDAIIKPIVEYLKNSGVNFSLNTEITDILMTNDHNTVTGLTYRQTNKDGNIPVRVEDMVFFTNGSMTQNSTLGDMHTIAKTNRDTEERGCFTVWEKLATKDEKFGHPDKFISNIDLSKFETFFLTITDYPEFYDRLEQVSGVPIGTNGIMSCPESSWDISYFAYHKPYFPSQPANVQVGFGYGLWGERCGNYIKKAMCDCTGEEIITEFLYHFGMLDLKDELIKHTKIETCMMPYITSQFMPRELNDRPKVIPDGCTNLAFIGQFVETPADAVFTVETSCRTGMQAAYALSGVEKKPLEVAPTFYDLRYIIGQLKKIQNIDGKITAKDLPKINPLKIKETEQTLLNLLNNIEDYPSSFPGRELPEGYHPFGTRKK